MTKAENILLNMNCLQCGSKLSGHQKKFCSKSCAASYNNKLRDKKIISEIIAPKISNSLKKYYNNIRIAIYRKCKKCGCEFEIPRLSNGHLSTKKFCSESCKIKYISENNKQKNTGGYKKGSGRGKGGWYKKIYCDSSWELAFVIYHIEHNMNIKRCTERRKYIFDNKEHIYIPDFITDMGIIEIKGYNSKQWEAKKFYNPDVIVLYKDDMKKYIDYAVNKYGKNFITLYENEEIATYEE